MGRRAHAEDVIYFHSVDTCRVHLQGNNSVDLHSKKWSVKTNMWGIEDIQKQILRLVLLERNRMSQKVWPEP